MRITMIHGQNHKGSTYYIGRMLADHFPDSEISEFFLPQDLEHFCLGCYSCVEEENQCPYYSEKRRIMREVEKADLLIFTTPTYCMRASAPMKAFMDLTFPYWMSHRPRSCMFHKKAVVFSTAAGAGAKSAVKDVANMLFYWGVPFVKTYGVAVQAMSWDQVADKKKAKIREQVDKLAEKIKEKEQVRVGIKTKAVFYAMRLMQKRNLGSSGSEREYWEENGWLGRGRPWKQGPAEQTEGF